MAASRVERLQKIADELQEAADKLEEKETMSDADEEKHIAYGNAADSIREAIDELESIG